MSEKDWYSPENWSNKKISYNQAKNVMFFDTDEESEEAVISFPVPENAQSFSLSFKIGNSCTSQKIGYQDCGKVTVGFGGKDNAEEIYGVSTPNILGEEKFVIYSLGTEEKPITIGGEAPKYLYFKVYAHNAANDGMDVYFGDFDLQFYDEVGALPFADYVSFTKQQTDERAPGGGDMMLSFVLMLIVLVVSGALGIIFKKKKGKKKADL